MPTPGDRRSAICRGCKAPMLMIYSAGDKWMPCQPETVVVDGKRMLVFGNGTVGRSHESFTSGHESHFAYCPKAKQFKPKRTVKATCFGDECSERIMLEQTATGWKGQCLNHGMDITVRSVG